MPGMWQPLDNHLCAKCECDRQRSSPRGPPRALCPPPGLAPAAPASSGQLLAATPTHRSCLNSWLFLTSHRDPSQVLGLLSSKFIIHFQRICCCKLNLCHHHLFLGQLRAASRSQTWHASSHCLEGPSPAPSRGGWVLAHKPPPRWAPNPTKPPPKSSLPGASSSSVLYCSLKAHYDLSTGLVVSPHGSRGSAAQQAEWGGTDARRRAATKQRRGLAASLSTF